MGAAFSLPATAQVTVLSRQPARHALAVAHTAPVTVGFSQAISLGTAGGLRVYGALRQGKYTGNLSGGGTATLTFTPSQAYAPGEVISVSVPSTLASTGGGTVARQVYQFTAATGGTGRGFFLDTARVGNTATRDQVLGDLDNDGDLDLLTTGALFGCRVFLNDGTGKYTFKTGFLSGEVQAGLVLTDVNQDGYLDVLTGDSKNSLLAVRLNDGTGDFSLPISGYQNAPVGAGPASIATGDVDGDGDLDFVTANTVGNSASVWLNSGTNLTTGFYFNTTYTVSMGRGPTAVALADIDNDGDLDLLTTNAGTSTNPLGEVHVSRNSGTGTFGAYTAVAVGLQPSELALADLDSDGDLDLLTANAGEASVSVRLNSGTGSFGGTTTLTLPAGSTPSSLRTGDVDADGDLDLVVAQGNGGRVFTYLNTAGSFAAQGRALRLSRDATLAAIGVTLGDVDGDGDLDVLTSDDRGNVVLSRNVGPPPPLPAPAITSLLPTSGPVGTSVALAGTNLTDVAGVFFNGVAAPSFTLSGAGTSLSVVVPAGASSGPVTVVTEDAGTAVSPSSFTVTIPVPVLLTSMAPVRNMAAAPPNSILAATFTVPITAATAGNIRVFGNQRRGRRPGSLTGGNSRTLSFDPDQDFMPGEQISLSLPASLRAADGNAVRPQVVQFTAAVGGTGRHDFFLTNTVALPGTGAVLLGDIDNDGDLDLAACGGTAGVRLQLNTGNGTFATGTTLSSPSAANYLALGDVDADGDLDLISSSAAGAGVVWLGDGRGAFVNAGTLALPGRNYLSQLTLADVDADGDLDLLALANNVVSVLFNSGQGTFATKQDFYFGIAALDMALGDLDADGDLDLVLPGRNSSIAQDLVVVAFNNGSGDFSASPALDFQVPAVQQVALADLDGDGDLDLATYSYVSYTNQVTTRLNDGSGHFGSALATLPLAAPDLVLADSDADGDLDLITPLGVGLNDGTGRLAQLIAPNELANTTAIAVGDLDGDGDLDLLTNDQTGTVRIRLNRPGPPPTLATLAPSSGPVGSDLLLTGTNLATVSGITFNGQPATSYFIISATQVVVAVPTGATSGSVALTTPAGTATGSFSVTAPLPIVALSPARNTPNAAPPATISLRFAQPVTAASAAGLRVSGHWHGRLAGLVTGGGTSTLTFAPSRPPAAGEIIHVSIPDQLASLDGSRAVRQVSQFTVAAGGTGTGLLLAGPSGRATAALNSRYGFAVGDLDQDGDLDVLTTAGRVRYNDGTGAFPDSTNNLWLPTPTARRVALADLDSDGDLDVLSTNGQIMLNTGPAHFNQQPIIMGLGDQIHDLAVGDLDADGDLDLVVPNYARDSIYVLFNDGAGYFATRLAVAVGSSPAGISLGDIDNDGDLDFVTANEGTAASSLSIGFNNGIGWFGEVRTVAAGTGMARASLGDLDGDHDLDVVTNNGFVLLNDGAGTFSSGQPTPSGQGLALGDLDADGDLDLVVTGAGTSAVRRNDGTGQLGGTETMDFGPSSQGHDPVLADLDGDGDLDMLTGDATTHTVLVSLNQRLAPPTLLRFLPASDLPGAVVVLTGTDFIGAISVTFNGVAAPDFTVVTATRLEVRVPAGASTGLLEVTNTKGAARSATAFTVLGPMAVMGSSPAANTIVPRTAAVSVTFAQPVATHTAANLVVFSQQRGGQLAGTRSGAGSSTLTFTLAQPYLPGELLSVSLPPYTDANQHRVVRQVYQFTAATGGTGRAIFDDATELRSSGSPFPVLGDIDGDGDLDLLYIFQNRVQIQHNDGRGAFGSQSDLLTFPYTGPYADNISCIKLGDVDGDGDLDLAIADVDNADRSDTAVVHLRLNDGRGHFAPGEEVLVDARPAEMALVDLDADGDLDLYTTNVNSYGTSTYNATCSVRLNDGNGHFSGTRNQLLNSLSSRFYSQEPVMGDVDGDGDIDLIGDEAIRGRIYFNDGQGQFTQGTENLMLSYDNTATALRDVDGDGDLDLLTVRVNTGLGVLLNDGHGHFPTFIENGSPYNYDGFEMMAVGDLDADGDLDVLLTTGSYYGLGRALLNDGHGHFARTPPLTLPYPNQGGLYPAPALGDLDGDGDLDLVCGTNHGLVSYLNGAGKPLAAAPPTQLAAQVSVYPNPAHGQFVVVVPAALRPTAAGPVQLVNTLGQLVHEQQLRLSASGELVVAVAHLPPGLYTLHLPLRSGRAVYKISLY